MFGKSLSFSQNTWTTCVRAMQLSKFYLEEWIVGSNFVGEC